METKRKGGIVGSFFSAISSSNELPSLLDFAVNSLQCIAWWLFMRSFGFDRLLNMLGLHLLLSVWNLSMRRTVA